MTAPAVVKHLDVINDILPGNRSAEIPHSKDLLNFEAAEETLRHRSSSTAEFHRYALTEPCVNLSIHTALVIQP